MEKYNANFNSKLVFHTVLHFPNTCILAFPFYIFRLADRPSSAQTLQTHEEVRILAQGFHFKQIAKI